MFLTEDAKIGIRAFMRRPGATAEKINAVVAVLDHGNEKHKTDDADILMHLARAEGHCRKIGNEAESGQPHWAHAVARLILAIERIVRDSECAG